MPSAEAFAPSVAFVGAIRDTVLDAATEAGMGLLIGAVTQQPANEPGADYAPRARRLVRRMPAAMRLMKLSRVFPKSVHLPEDSMDYLIRVLIARDTWTHRVDITDAR